MLFISYLLAFSSVAFAATAGKEDDAAAASNKKTYYSIEFLRKNILTLLIYLIR